MIGMTLEAQNIFEQKIMPILEQSCNNNGCHGGTNPSAGLQLSGDAADVYANLFNVGAQNVVAAAAGELLVNPGYPERSFLYRKINDGLHSDSPLGLGEGATMPVGPLAGTLTDAQKEIIRQWIYLGAPLTTSPNADVDFFLNEDWITEYYEEGGIATDDPPPPPAVGEGFQIQFGPVFLGPDEEIEVLKLYELPNLSDVEVNRMDLTMSDFSHHFIIYKYDNEPNQPPGMRELDFTNLISSPLGFGNARFVSIWQDEQDFRLPEGTAYKWDGEDVLDLNFHIRNYSSTQVLAATAYVNIYTQPFGTAEKEMFSDLEIYHVNVNNGLGILDLVIPANSEITYDEEVFLTNQNRNIWMVSSHTHQLGKDFDVFLRNDDGSKGLQIFEGFYNSDYTSDQGFYDYEHPPVRYFDNFIEMPPFSGLVHEAYYENTTNQEVTFGLTTQDEMMMTILQYTVGDTHQDEMDVNEIPATVCISDEPIVLNDSGESGILGNGVLGNIFYPDLAGPGTHEIMINCCDDTQYEYIEVTPLPELPIVEVQENDIVVLNGDDFDFYQWYLNGELLDGENNSSITIGAPGLYYVVAGYSETCSSESETAEVVISGLEDISNIDFVVMQDANRAIIKIGTEFNTNQSLSIFDLSGKMIQTFGNHQVDQLSNQYEINFETLGLSGGTYLIHWTNQNSILSKKLIVIR